MPAIPKLLNAKNFNSAFNQTLAYALGCCRKSVGKFLITPKQSAGGSKHGMGTGFQSVRLYPRRLDSSSRTLVMEGAGNTGPSFPPWVLGDLSAQ